MEFLDKELPLEQRRAQVAERIQKLRIAGRALEDNKEELPNGFEKREYQLDSWASIWEARHNGTKSGLLHLATGLGKTSVAVLDVMKFQGERKEQNKRPPRVLFVSHQDNLLSQSKDRFLEFLPNSSTELYKTQKENLPEADITFATFQSLRNELGRFSKDYFDYIIYDEAHHTKAETFSDVVEHFDPEFQLALTATPERTDEKDIREHFGKPVYSKSLAEAMAEGLVADVDYHIVFDDAIKKAMEDGFDATMLKEIRELLSVSVRNETIARNILEEREQMNLDDAKTIVFCNGVAHANKMAELLEGEAYHSGISKAQQQDILRRFRNGELRTITVKDMFNEGVDIPDARLIVFLRSTQSKTVFEQQLGRGLRKQLGKDTVSVLDFVANIERLSMMQEMIKKIKKRSEELGEILREGYKDRGESGFSVTTSHDNFEFDKLSIELTNKLNEIIENLDRSHLNLLTNEGIIELAKHYSPDSPLGVDEINKLSKENNFVSLNMIHDRFKSTPNFQRACGFEVRDFAQFTNNELISLAKELSSGDQLGVYKMDKLSKENKFPNSSTISKRFGSIPNFQRACGFEILKREYINFSNEELVELAKELSSDKPLTATVMSDLSKEGKFPTNSMIVKRFGSLYEFKKACGFEIKDYRVSRRFLQLTNEELIELAKELSPDKPLTKSEIDKLSKDNKFPSTGLIAKRFGSMMEFKRACGFEVRDFTQLTNEELIELAKKFSPDKPLKRSAVIRLSKENKFPSDPLLTRRFGSMVKFKKACGFEVKEVKKWSNYSDEELIELAKKLDPNKKLNTHNIRQLSKAGKFPGTTTITKRFGSLSNFWLACGFED